MSPSSLFWGLIFGSIGVGAVSLIDDVARSYVVLHPELRMSVDGVA